MFYNNNRFTNMAGIEVEPNMAYAHENGALVAMIEGYENERALFEAAIMTDVQEASMIAEGASEEEISALQESAIGSFFTKIKELFKKLWEKIKAVFHGFIARFDSLFKGDAALVKKYETEVRGKNLADVEFKFSTIKHDRVVPAPNADILIAYQEKMDDFDSDKFTADELSKLVGNNFKCSEVSEFDKEFHEFLFNDEAEVKGDTLKDIVIKELKNKDVTKDAEKINQGLDKTIKKVIDHIDKAEKEFGDKSKKNGSYSMVTKVQAGADFTKGDIDGEGVQDKEKTNLNMIEKFKGHNANHAKGGQIVNSLRTQANCIQTAITKYSSASIKELKWYHSQCRAVFGKMAAANGGKNEAAFLEEVENAILYETDVMFDQDITCSAE